MTVLQLAAMILLAFSLATRATIIVQNQPGCSDGAAGTEAAPLCSIAAALAKSRQTTDREVALRAGTFPVFSTLRLTEADSGLTLKAFGTERVRVSGGMVVTGWKQSPTKGIWTAPIPALCNCVGSHGGADTGKGSGCGPTSCIGYSSPRQLYVGGRRANRTSANASILLGGIRLGPEHAVPPQTPDGVLATGDGGSYVVDNPALKGWGAASVELGTTDMEFVYPAQIVPWTEPRCGIKSVSTDGHTLRMQNCLKNLPIKPGCASGPAANKTQCPRRWFMAGLPGLIENALELLSPTKPGQFYVDRSTATVHYVPHPGEDLEKLETVLPLVETLLDSSNATNLTISGIDWVYTAWGGADQPSGYVPIQAGWSMRPLTEPHSLGPSSPPSESAATAIAGAATIMVQRSSSFVLGAGGKRTFLDSARPELSRLTSRSGAAVLNMQGDANVCITLYKDAEHSQISGHSCFGAPVCPCAPVCRGKEKLPPFCNTTSIAGYKLVVSATNLCVLDTAANTTRWCALNNPEEFVHARDVREGQMFLMLGDDGSVCLHAGVYSTASSANSTVWCSLLSPESSNMEQKQVPGAVRIRNTSHTIIVGNRFGHMGGAGLDIFGGSQHTSVSGNYAHDISGTAIQFGGIDPCPACPQGKTPCGVNAPGQKKYSGIACPSTLPSPSFDLNLSFTDNVIADVTREFHGCLGVWGGYARQARFFHNDICRTAYGGLSLGWGWAIDWTATFQRENEIAYNHITHWMGVLDDSGATYTLGPHPNSSLHHNYAAHAGEIGIVNGGPTGASGSGIEPGNSHHGGAYYPDDGSAFWNISYNVATDLNGGEWLFAWNANDQHDLTVNENYVDTNTYICASKTCSVTGTVVVNRSIFPPQPWPAAAQNIIAAAGARVGKMHPDAVGVCK